MHTKGHTVPNAEFYHEPPHPLLLDSFVFLLLLPFCVGMVRGHSLCEFLNFACDGSVIFFEILGMLKNAIEVFLWGHMRQDWLLDRSRRNTSQGETKL